MNKGMHLGIVDVWPRLLCLAAAVCFPSGANGQNAQNAANPCAHTKAGQVCSELATLAIKVHKSAYKEHEPIDVELVLRAGKKGVFLPSYFGDFMKGCRNGFSAHLFTLDGRLAADAHSSCAGSWLFSGNDTAQDELHNFVRLSPGETRTWHTTLATGTLKLGQYRIIAEYLSFADKMEEVSRLPQVEGLMAQGRITAPPVIVTIR